ncbi:IclR family transcriptional regulator C-terminal domain-containing protein [Tritonibacter mobilis]|nr:IclR family transcriptional regulator C-terminal domain-containing protein [Tritonibacter mobilis]
MEGNYTLQTVERAFAFLECVANSKEPLATRDVAERLELNITTCYHIQRTLIGLNYISKRRDGRLEVGRGVLPLYRGYRGKSDPEKELSKLAASLGEITRETAFLSIREGDEVVLKELFEGVRRLRVGGLKPGMRGAEHRRAAGKAVLAHLGADDRLAMLDASLRGHPEARRKSGLDRLNNELLQISDCGYAIDEETEEGIIAIAAPFFARGNRVRGAVGIVLPRFRFDGAPDKYLEVVLSTASQASDFASD